MKQTNLSIYKIYNLVLALLTTGAFNLKAQDQITLNNNSGNPIGVLVDGKLSGSNVNDQTYVSSGSPVAIGQFSKANGNNNNEIMAFTEDRPMAIYTSVPWTTGKNNISVPFSDEILIPITIWVVYGNFDTVSTKITNDVLTASTIFNTERLGIDFSSVNVINATADPEAPNYYSYDNSTMSNSIKTDIGFVNGQINIYYVMNINVGGSTFNGGIADQNGGTIIAMGSPISRIVLAHEIGHLFTLQHIHSGVANSNFDFSNLMSTNGSQNALYLTEGQSLRVHLTPTSAINDTYNARPGKPTRTCSGTATTPTNTCPEVQKRIWSDGTYPAN